MDGVVREVRVNKELNSDKREKKWIWSVSQKKMVLIPEGNRPTVGAYKHFKRPAFSVLKRGGDKSERETSA